MALNKYHSEGVITGIVYALFCAAMLLRLQHYPSVVNGTDAHAYLTYALNFRTYGLMSDFGNIRTYGYPVFIYFLSFLFGRDLATLAMWCGVVRACLFGAAVFWLSRTIEMYGRPAGLVVLIGVLLNPFLISVVVDVVSESLLLTLFVVVLCTLLKLSQAETPWSTTYWVALGAIVGSFSVMVRPSSVLIVVAWLVAVCWCFMARRPSARVVAACMLLWCSSAIAFWAPQYIYNAVNFGQAQILPVCPIGKLQLAYGIVLIKYETLILPNGVAPLYFVNPWLNGTTPTSESWEWYLQHPTAGALTAATHLFNSFDVNHLFVYLHAWPPMWAETLSFMTWTFLFLGASLALKCGTSWLYTQNKCSAVGPMLPLVLSVVVVLFGGINAVSAVEVRLNIIPLAVLVTMGAAAVAQMAYEPRERAVAKLAVVFLLAVVATMISTEMKKYARTDMPIMLEIAESIRPRCAHSR